MLSMDIEQEVLMKREVKYLHRPVPATDGAGVKLQRAFPVATLDHVDPFLLLDHFGAEHPDDFIAGFPMHPHRGIETVTYMLEGRINHRDSTGRAGTIEAGDVQWMSAGRGIMHEEMPERADGRLAGLQLWLNLPADEKMKPAEYREYKASEIEDFEHNGHRIRLVSGELLGHSGPVTGVSTLPVYADIRLQDGELVLKTPAEHQAFLYVFEGHLEVVGAAQTQAVQSPCLVVLKQGEEVHLQTREHARLMFGAARKLEEPIARHGPFVMNTHAQIEQTLRELHGGNFPPQ